MKLFLLILFFTVASSAELQSQVLECQTLHPDCSGIIVDGNCYFNGADIMNISNAFIYCQNHNATVAGLKGSAYNYVVAYLRTQIPSLTSISHASFWNSFIYNPSTGVVTENGTVVSQPLQWYPMAPLPFPYFTNVFAFVSTNAQSLGQGLLNHPGSSHVYPLCVN